MEQTQMVRVVNRQARLIILPKIEVGDREYQPRLPPGGTNVPAEYFKALDAEIKRKEGLRKFMHGLEVSLNPDGTQGALLFDTDPDAVAQPEGVEPPAALVNYRAAACQAMIDAQTQPTVLRRWYRNERREQIRGFLEHRAADLGVDLSFGA